MKDSTKQQVILFIGGAVFMTIIATLKYLTNTNIGILGLIAAFIFGAVLTLVGTTKHTSFVKNLIFISAIIWLLWVGLNPIKNVAGNWIINKTEFLLIITFVIIVLERNAINSFKDIFKKKPSKAMGFIGSIALLIFISVSGVLDPVFKWVGEHPYYLAIIMLAWFTFLYFFIAKTFTKTTNNLLAHIIKGRRR